MAKKTKKKPPTWDDPGVYRGVPDVTYHASPHMNHSRLPEIRECPAKDYQKQQYPADTTQTDAQLLGTVTHFCVLQPELYDQYVVARPKLDQRNKANKEQTLAWQLEAEEQGKLLITEEDEAKVCRMRDSVHAHPKLKGLLSGEREFSIVWDELVSGVRCRSRIDCKAPGAHLLLDLKTTMSSKPRYFLNTAIPKWNYHSQASFYWTAYEQAVAKPDGYWIIAVEKTAPYVTTVIETLPEMRQAGELIWREGLLRYLECLESSRWPGYTDELVQGICPEWIKEGLEDDEGNEDSGF